MHIDWEQYFMGIALLSAKRSKDPSTQVGAVIVSPDNQIVSVGWNGMPNLKKCCDNDTTLPWGKDSPDPLQNKYMYVVHAEPNAILAAQQSVKGCTMYLTWFPCGDCAKFIVQAGISKLVYLHANTSERYRVSMEAARILMDSAGVIYTEYASDNSELVLTYKPTGE